MPLKSLPYKSDQYSHGPYELRCYCLKRTSYGITVVAVQTLVTAVTTQITPSQPRPYNLQQHSRDRTNHPNTNVAGQITLLQSWSYNLLFYSRGLASQAITAMAVHTMLYSRGLASHAITAMAVHTMLYSRGLASHAITAMTVRTMLYSRGLASHAITAMAVHTMLYSRGLANHAITAVTVHNMVLRSCPCKSHICRTNHGFVIAV